MQFMLQPYHILLAALIGWANERQQRIIEFQSDQIEAKLKMPCKKRLLHCQFPLERSCSLKCSRHPNMITRWRHS
ncbi:MAG: hypothetical protein ACI8P0_006314 [Planctomycetaceae bacterium]|jgi:hypothetical protein